jgi:outer membrane protein OmpA-like peptidoglycan-associated protein
MTSDRERIRRPAAPTSPPVSAMAGPRSEVPVAGRGANLPSTVRAPFERALGRDFADVRIHPASGPRASTLGVDVALPEGRQAADAEPDRWVLAHELAHVVQQSRGGTGDDPEARATAAADAVVEGSAVAPESLGGAPIGAQMQPQPKGDDVPPTGSERDTPGATGAPGAKLTSGAGLDGFGRDKAVLSPGHLASLDQLAWSVNLHLGMLKAGHASIQVVGHTDTTGTEKHNSGLGQQRADAVRTALADALKKHGVTTGQLDPIGTSSAGESDLAVKTADEVDEPRNRRVHIEVTITAPAPPTTAPAVDPNAPRDQGKPGAGAGTPLPAGPGPAPSTPSRPWLEEALRKDDLLKQLPKWARDKAIDGLKDMDETAVDKVIDAVPWDDQAKAAAKAALKALLRTFKGQKFKLPDVPSRSPDFGLDRDFPKLPGEHIFKLPPIRFDWP